MNGPCARHCFGILDANPINRGIYQGRFVLLLFTRSFLGGCCTMPRTRRTKTPILRRRNSIDSTPITDIAEGTVTVTGGSFYPISRRLRGVRVREHGTEIHLHRHSTPNGASPRRTRASTRLQKNSLSPNIHSHREH